MEIATIVCSAAALAVSLLTLWITLLRSGRVKMTQPAVLFFGPDGDPKNASQKIFLRSLLYSTSRKGRILESMYVKARRGETTQTFNIWVHGDEHLSRGSGMYVGYEGVSCNHHFLLPEDGTQYNFLAGKYVLMVFARIVGSSSDTLLRKVEVTLSEANAKELTDRNKGVYFDWGPESEDYHSHVRDRPNIPDPSRLFDILNEPK